MKFYSILFIFTLYTFNSLFSQSAIVINELDCDTPGVDDKEFVELKSTVPNFSLDGYVLVFFNGSDNGGNTSYLTLDLEGYKTDINGVFLVGSSTVTPFPQYSIPVNVIQNGADAVAVYKADAEDFPDGTLAYVDSTLIDVLLYDTNDADVESMIAIFRAFDPGIQQINEGNTNNTNSIQRHNDGSYFAGVPTPRRLNDGTGVILNGVRTIFNQTQYNEGESFEIVFTTEHNVETDLLFEFSLNNENFNASDYVGITNLIILKGQNTVSTTITLIDDAFDEGDEVLLLMITGIPANYLLLNNNVTIRIVDNDFRIANFGTPTHPTFGKVLGTQPNDYYSDLQGLADNELRDALQSILADTSIVRFQTYDDVIDILKQSDQNPENSNQIWLVYLEKGRPKLDFQLSANNVNTWNREHTWPRSRGGFDSIEGDDNADGPDIFRNTHADSTRHANSDAHAIRAEDAQENSSRGNMFYGEYNGPQGTAGSFKGDVARGIFFLDVRYNGLEVVNGYPEGQVGKFGDLATLLEWHRNDPPDDFEMNRNNIVYFWQKNRNPFIDKPDMVEYLWGNKIGQVWQNPSSTSSVDINTYHLYPNPTKNKITIEGIKDNALVEIFTAQGILLLKQQTSSDTTIDIMLQPGIYIVNITSKGKTSTQKMIVE
ncbi:MAG: endonuclease [Saprospiraceae bacterium]|nr:endonuclease [Saprospiraceae bacterium]